MYGWLAKWERIGIEWCYAVGRRGETTTTKNRMQREKLCVSTQLNSTYIREEGDRVLFFFI